MADEGRTIPNIELVKLFSHKAIWQIPFYIRVGKAKITVTSEEGKEAVVAILGPDEFAWPGSRDAWRQLRQMTECEIMRLEKAAIVRVLHDEQAFSEMFVAHLLARTPCAPKRIWSTNLSTLVRNVWRERFSYWQILERRTNANQSLRRSAKRRSRRVIGTTTRSRVSRFMNTFRKLASSSTTAL